MKNSILFLILVFALLMFCGCSEDADRIVNSRVDKYSEAILSTYTVEASSNAKFTYDVYLKDGEPEFIWITGPMSEEETHYDFPAHIDHVPITGIAEGAFSYAPITSLDLPGELEYIGRRAFYNCPALTSVTIPSSVYYLGDYAFYSCVVLETVKIPDTLSWIGGLAFKDTPWLDGQTDEFVLVGDHVLIDANVTGEVTVPAGVRCLSSAFYCNETITRVTLPEGIIEIGPAAFMGCTSLTEVNIPASTLWIGDSAFRMCSSLPSLTLTEGITAIGVHAFDGMGGSVEAPAGSAAEQLLKKAKE